MLRKIKIYGKLRQIVGKATFEADLNNIGQAFSFLCCNYPEVANHLQNQVYKVYSGDKVINDETLCMTGDAEIRIIPVACGTAFVAPFVAPFIGSAVGGVVEGVTNVPMARMANLMLQMDNAMDSNHKWWQRVALALGQNTWDLGIQDPDIEALKVEIKEERKRDKAQKRKIEKSKKGQNMDKKIQGPNINPSSTYNF